MTVSRRVAVVVAALCAAVLVQPGEAGAAPGRDRALVVDRHDRHPAVVPFATAGAGAATLRFTVAAPGVDWGVRGRESAVVEVSVDGRRVTDVVVPVAAATAREVGLGDVRRGRHRLQLRFAAAKSSPGAHRAVFTRLRVDVARAGTAAAVVRAHAPVVIGRVLPELGTPFQNATTDAPLIAWHEERPASTPGHRVLEYSVIWSNEDGGTDTPALMARWGRTTDIEWIYRVEVDAAGRTVTGSDVYQAPNHATLAFTGRYDGQHPILQTCTSNNNMCDAVVTPAGGVLRFLLGVDATRPADRAREALMDANPWTYQVTAAEMVREGKVETPSDPATPAMGDQRTYLFVEVDKDTGAATGTGSAPGLTLGVRLRGSDTLYRTDHGHPDWSIARDDPAATTIELPAGTTAADIAEVVAIRQPMGAGDNGAPVTVTSVNRAFFLGAGYLPGASFLAFATSETLTTARPSAPIWTG